MNDAFGTNYDDFYDENSHDKEAGHSNPFYNGQLIDSFHIMNVHKYDKLLLF